MADILDLYNKASLASKSSPNNQKDLLITHINELYELITEELSTNIMNAANRGLHHAILAIYKVAAMHRRIIPIRSMLFPPPKLTAKMSTLGIQSLTEILNNKLKPFTISVVPINTLYEVVEIHDIEAIVVNWT